MATPVFCCGGECGVFGSALHWVISSGSPSFSTSTVRSGSRSLRINPTAATQFLNTITLTANAIWVGRCYVRFTTLPDVDAVIFAAETNSSGAYFKASDSKIYAGTVSSATLGATGVSVTTGVWYRIDVKVDATTNPWVVDVSVDGVACGQKTRAVAGSTFNRFSVGLSTGTADYFIDDVVLSNTLADYPIGPGKVEHFVPTADGTHNVAGGNDFERSNSGTDINNATTTAYQLIDDVPLKSGVVSEYINLIAPPNATDYVEVIAGPAPGISTPTVAPRAVEAIMAYASASAGTFNIRLALNDNGTINDVLNTNTAPGTTATYGRKHYAAGPAGAWVIGGGGNGDFTDLRMRCFTSDPAPDPWWASAMIEAEFAEGTIVLPDVGSLTLAGFEPTVAVTSNKVVTPDVGVLSVAGFEPTVSVPRNVAADVGVLTLDGFTPTLSVSDNKNVLADVGSITLTGSEPIVAVTAHFNASPGVGDLQIAGFAPTVQTPININTDLGVLEITGFVPTIVTPVNVNTSTGELTITGHSPSVTVGDAVEIQTSTGELVVTGFAPTLIIPVSASPETGVITATGFNPTIETPRNIQADTGQVVFVGFSPTISISGGEVLIDADFGQMVLIGYAPLIEALQKEFLNINSPVDNGNLNSEISEGAYLTRVKTVKRIKSKIDAV